LYKALGTVLAMKYFIISISIFLSIHPLSALASVWGGGLALTTYSTSEVSTGGIQVGGSGSAYSESGSASVEIKNTLNTQAGSGVVEVEVKTESNGVVHTESVKKAFSPSDKSVQVFVATSSGAGVSAQAEVWQGAGEASSSEWATSTARTSTTSATTIFGTLPRVFYFFTYSIPVRVSHWFSDLFSFFGSR